MLCTISSLLATSHLKQEFLPYERSGRMSRSLYYNISLQASRALRGEEGTHTQRTVITGVFTRGTCAVELDATDAADVVFGHVPAPGGDCVPFVYCDFHGGWGDPLSASVRMLDRDRGREESRQRLSQKRLRWLRCLGCIESICFVVHHFKTSLLYR